MLKLKIDPSREGRFKTGILVRAQSPEGEWKNVDIGSLDDDSLVEWLHQYPGRAEHMVLSLMGYKTFY